MNHLSELLKKIKEENFDLDIDKIEKAYLVASKAHEWKKRENWADYITHPIGVAIIVLDLKPDTATIVSALLHDTLEDTNLKKEEIEEEFWKDVANIVDWLTKVAKVESIWFERQVNSLRKMFISMAQDLRVVFIKLADRLHNLQTIEHLSSIDKRQKIAKETLEIYAPIAQRLGIYKLKQPLEEISFKILENENYESISKQLAKFDISYIEKVKKNVSIVLHNEWCTHFKLLWRIKEHYSIHKKMQRKRETNIREIYDIFALRIIVDNLEDCYKVLWIIHKNWTPMTERFKDYLAIPKINWYRSLHTVVTWIWKQSWWIFRPVEIQIRTKEMHAEAEYWAASHWSYKEQNVNDFNKTYQNFISSLSSLQQDIEDHSEFLNQIQLDALNKRIFVLTPNWEIKDLPEWATPIDFAFSVHTTLWLTCTWAMINNKHTSLSTHLQNWDIVKIISRKNWNPNPQWLNIVKTSHAKQAIKKWLEKLNEESLIQKWKDLLNEQLKRFWKNPLDSNLSILQTYEWNNLTKKDRINLLANIWNWKIGPYSIIKANVLPLDNLTTKIKKGYVTKDKNEENNDLVLVEWELKKNMRIAKKCCNPESWDKIFAYVTRWSWFSIHKKNCSFARSADKTRFLLASWISDEKEFFWILNISFTEHVWIIANIMSTLENFNIEINNINFSKKISWLSEIKIEIHFPEFKKISYAIDEIKNINWIQKVIILNIEK